MQILKSSTFPKNVLLSSLILMSSCTENFESPDSRDFVAACLEKIEYRASVKRDGGKQVTRHCECVYNTTMQDLSPAAQDVAKFYLQGQAGISVEDRTVLKDLHIDDMTQASIAIAKAVKICPRP